MNVLLRERNDGHDDPNDTLSLDSGNRDERNTDGLVPVAAPIRDLEVVRPLVTRTRGIQSLRELIVVE